MSSRTVTWVGFERTPILPAKKIDGRNGIVHELLAPNGSGKSFLLDFIVHSLVEDVKLDPSGSWFLSPEKVGRVNFFRKEYDGKLEGELLLEAGDYVFRSTYEYDMPVRREFTKKDSGVWHELSDSQLWKHINLAYLVPQDPAERVKNLKGKLVDKVQDAYNDYSDWMGSLEVAIDNACREGQNPEKLKAWKKRQEEVGTLIGKKQEAISDEKKNQSGYFAYEELKKLKVILQKETLLAKEMRAVEEELENLPVPTEAPDTEKLADRLRIVRNNITGHRFVSKIRGFVSLVIDRDEAFQRDYREIPLVEDFRMILDYVGWRGVRMEEAENCFVTEHQKAMAHVMRLVQGCGARRAEIDSVLDTKLAKQAGEARVLEVLRQFIAFIEDNRGDALSDLFQSKLGATNSVDSIEQILVKELKSFEGNNARTQLDSELDELFEDLLDEFGDFKKVCKKYIRAKNKLSQAALFQGDEFAAKRMDLNAKRGDLSTAFRLSNEARKGCVKKLNDYQIEDWSDSTVRKRHLDAWGKAFKSIDVEVLGKLEADVGASRAEELDLARNIRLEERKPVDVLQGYDKNRAKLLKELLGGFPAKLRLWKQDLSQNSLNEEDMKLFGAIVADELGGVVRFDGKNNSFEYIDFVRECFVLDDGSHLLFQRLSGAQAGEVAFRLHIDSMLQSGKPSVLLFDEAGDMDADTWKNIYGWMRPNKNSIAFMMKVGAKMGPVSIKTVEL